MIHLLLETLESHATRATGTLRSAELTISRKSARLVLMPKLPKLWIVSLDVVRLNHPEQEKSGLHVSGRDRDDWSTICYRRPGGRTMAVLVVGRRESWFERAGKSVAPQQARGVA